MSEFESADHHRHTAIHEAGHAVIGRVLGMVCGQATIESDYDSAGHSLTADLWVILSRWEAAGKFRDEASVLRGRILTFQAGAEAEAEILGVCHGGDDDDRSQVAMMAGDLGREDCGEALRRHARRLVRRHRAKIERVAVALLSKRRLTARQIDLLVWPKAMMTDVVSLGQLRKFRITVTQAAVTMAMRRDMFPRAYLFNGRMGWRVRDVEPLAGLVVRMETDRMLLERRPPEATTAGRANQ
jgi:hypothetical protein